jgi:acyl-coenzyme A synthetase/AMP-(fatty) acid ligase
MKSALLSPQALDSHKGAIAVIDAATETQLSYHRLADLVSQTAAQLLCGTPAVAFLFAEPDIGTLICYLACRAVGHAVFILPMGLADPRAETLIRTYQPELLVFRTEVLGRDLPDARIFRTVSGYLCAQRTLGDYPPPHPDLSVMLSTSSSTGSAKLVRVSTDALTVNTAQICEALLIGPNDRTFTHLPLAYIYGLSVINSHLSVGATVILSSHSPASEIFWSTVRNTNANCLVGVTQTYSYMRHIGVSSKDLPALRKITHSGDRMTRDNAVWLAENMAPRGVDTYLMYGQTEASGRISVLPPRFFLSHPTSVGLPVTKGSLYIGPDSEIFYRGPNVMMGYAHSRGDLSLGDAQRGLLATGDQGHIDSAGFLFVSGRLHRCCKIFGVRVALDDIEDYFSSVCCTAAVEADGHIRLFFEGAPAPMKERLWRLSRSFRLPPQAFILQPVKAIPRTSNGKIAYRELT